MQMGRRLAIRAIKEGESRRLGDRIMVEGMRRKSRSGSGLGFEHLSRWGHGSVKRENERWQVLG